MARKILILMCDTGGGHRSVANAIVGALKRLFPGRYRFEYADLMADGFLWPLRDAGSMYGPVVNRFPRMWGRFWHLTNGRHRAPLTLRALSIFATPRLKNVLMRSKPGLILSTHPWANHIPAWLLQELGWEVPLVTVITDPVSIHHWWLWVGADLCLVPTRRVRRAALDAGLAPEAVKVVGIPVDPEMVNASRPQDELRTQLGLAENKFTVLLVGGAEGMGNLFAVATAVGQSSLDLQLVIVTGRNKTLKARLDAASWELPTRVLGFANNMPSLMRAADVLITKAGPSSISEALACGLPMLISGGLPGQEEGNVEWALASGAALFTPTSQKVVGALKDLLQPGKGILAAMARRARAAAKPDSALEAARMIDDFFGPPPDDMPKAAGAFACTPDFRF